MVLPSTSITRPVTSPASSEASQATIGELSSGSAICEVSKAPSVIRVFATGAMALTVTPYRPISWAATRVSPAMPALAAEYVAWPTEPCSPAPELVLMTRAARCRPSLASARQ